MNGPLIIVPKMMPPGERVEQGQKTPMPNCDRCRRTVTRGNPIVVLAERPAWGPNGPLIRRDAICRECQFILEGKL